MNDNEVFFVKFNNFNYKLPIYPELKLRKLKISLT